MYMHLWGAGVYALSEAAHVRLGQFPTLTADDLHVDQLFSRDEVAIVETTPVHVRCPRTSQALLRTLQRVQSGKAQVEQTKSIDAVGGLRPLLSGIREPAEVRDAVVYAGFSIAARVLARHDTGTWHRDDTNRVHTIADRPAVVPSVEATARLSTEPIDHVVLTRFNVPSQGVESLIRAKEGWLRSRVELFETYTVPSMERQQSRFTWLVYFDPDSPSWLREWLQSFAERSLFVPIFRTSVSHDDLIGDIRQLVERRSDVLITTNVDNDDGIAGDFLRKIQQAADGKLPIAVYLTNGLIIRDGQLFRRHDRHNAFCSVRESWDNPVTCWADWHNRLSLHMPVLEVRDAPAWLQVVHNTNVSNRVNGIRVPPDSYRARFAPLLDGVASPDRRSLVRDHLVGRPLRCLREWTRALLKRAILSVGGTEGLNGLKEATGRWKALDLSDSARR
jgi:hypothetical protein